jgi:hypothetical protein
MFLAMLNETRRRVRGHVKCRAHWLCASTLLVLASSINVSCANLSFERDSATSGTFESSGFAVTLISFDLPKGAMQIARENASDANLPNMIVTDTEVFPYLGWFDWILDIVGARYARVRGTWGATAKEAGG